MAFSHLLTAAHALRHAFMAACSARSPGPNLPVVLIPEAQWPEFVIRAMRDTSPLDAAANPCAPGRHDNSMTIAGIRFICSDDPRMNATRPLNPAPTPEPRTDDALHSRHDGSISGEKHHHPYRLRDPRGSGIYA